MKILILLTLLSCLAAAGCTGKRQQSPARETTGTDAGKEKLSALLDEMRARLAATTDTALYINAFGNGREGDSIRVALLRNSPEWQKRFRQHVMDSPVLAFDGPDGQEPCPLEGTARIGGVHLAPQQAAFSTADRTAHFILHNQSTDTISYGSAYSLAYERDGQWYYLPTDRFFTSLLIDLSPGGKTILSANLYPEVNVNRPGRYRFFKEVEMNGQEETMMAEFELAARVHRENGWYRLVDNAADGIALRPIVTVKELKDLRLDTDAFGRTRLLGNMSERKRQAWADSTEQAVGTRIGFVFNDSILSSPQVNMRIESGNFEIATMRPYDLKKLYRLLIQEKRDSLDALFRANGWEKDTLFCRSLPHEKLGSIYNSLDYADAEAIVQGFETGIPNEVWIDK